MSSLSTRKQENLRKIFYPQSIAVIGTNRVKGTVPHDIFYNILKAEFQGVIYPVSPKEPFISGIKAYKYVTDIPDPVDLAVLVFPSSVCHMALEQCGQKGITAAIIISAGFKEVGGAGFEREKQIKEIAAKYGISFIGPNCLGVINTDPGVMLDASFARKTPEEGAIGFLSQSGALCTAVLDYARGKHIGFSKFVSFGNKADVSEIDLLYYLRDDPKTKVILLYLEEITDGAGLMTAAREIIKESGKPILVLKAGRSPEGASAAASHTGSLAGSDEVCDAAFRQAGILRCNDIEEMFSKAIALTYQPLPRDRRVAIVTNAGGPGVLTTDAAIREGLQLARFTAGTTDVLKKKLPATANIKNPVDVIGDARADRYETAVTAVMQDPGVDGVFVILTPQSMTEIESIAQQLTTLAEHAQKPIYASFMGETDVAPGVDILQRHRIPHYILPETMCRAFASAFYFAHHRFDESRDPFHFTDVDKTSAHAILDKAREEQRSFLSELDAENVLRAYGFPVLPAELATDEKQAAAAAERIGFPLAMKIMSEDIIHKSDVGGVILNIASKAEVLKAFQNIQANVKKHKPEARLQGILLSRMIPRGIEVILGIKRDPSFGSVIMFGLGGIFVEILKDISLRIAPVAKHSATMMIRKTRSYPLLAGARGREEADLAAIEECIQRLSQLALECPQIAALDINPLIVLPKGQGAFVADARITL